MDQKDNLNKKIGISIGAVIIFLVAVVTFVSDKKTSVQPVTQTITTKPTSTAVAKVPPVVSTRRSVYKNGTYTANGTYMSPGGDDQISVSVTLANDIITDTTVSSVTADRTSLKYQKRFIAGYKQYVIGKNIADINLTNVSGSSLTPQGFNDALSQIMSQAKA